MKRQELEKCAEINDIFDTYLWEPVSFIFAKAFAKKGWSPNVATIISLILGVCGGIFFAPHNIWINTAGAILLLLSIIFDDADGQIARLNHSGSLFGRCFDGFCDDVVYLSVYIGLCIHLMSDNIPFTNTPWSFWIFLIAIPVGFYFHMGQARVADYLKNSYMYFIGIHSELSFSTELPEQFKNTKMNLFTKFLFESYLIYTKQQENENPKTQALLTKIKENGDVVPEKVTQDFKKHASLLKFANIELTSVRTLTLIALLLIGQGFWIFPVVVFVLEPINQIIHWRYSKISQKACEDCFK